MEIDEPSSPHLFTGTGDVTVPIDLPIGRNELHVVVYPLGLGVSISLYETQNHPCNYSRDY